MAQAHSRPNVTDRERLILPFDHPSVTATTTWKIWKVPTGRKFYVERVSYINPTGLTEDNSNNFAGAVRNGSVDIASLFNTDADLAPDTGASLAADTFVEGDLTPMLVFADATFTAATTDVVTITAHGLLTGDGPFRVSSSTTLPAGLAAATDYWIIKIDANTFKFASSLANAVAGTAVDITDTGTGTHTMVDTASTLRNLGQPANLWLAAGDIISLVVTETGAATLPAGRLLIEGFLY